MIEKIRHFIDRCGHKQNEFIGSVWYINKSNERQCLDVYIFKSIIGQEVCIRYGNEDSEYYSPTDLFTFLCCSHSIEYRKAIEVLREYGRLEYVLKK